MKASVAIAIIASIVACALFFLPYVSATDEWRESIENAIETAGDQQLTEEYDLTTSDLRGISALKYAEVAYQHDSANSKSDAILDIAIYGSLLGFAVLCLICACAKRPTPMILFAILMLLMNRLIHAVLVNHQLYNLGIACYGYYGCAAILVIVGIRIFVGKRKLKKQGS